MRQYFQVGLISVLIINIGFAVLSVSIALTGSLIDFVVWVLHFYELFCNWFINILYGNGWYALLHLILAMVALSVCFVFMG